MSSEPVHARRNPEDSARAEGAESAAGLADAAGSVRAAGLAGSAGAAGFAGSAGAPAGAASQDVAAVGAGGTRRAPASGQAARTASATPDHETHCAVAAAGPALGSTTPPGPRLPQLRMQFRAFAALQPVSLPPGYTLATLVEREVSEWGAVLHATGQLGAWDLARAERCLDDPRPVVPEGTYLILHRDRAVATACTVLPTPAEPRAELGWVAVAPAHQGHGLGLPVCRAVLWYARSRAWPVAILNTDDWRLAAIKTYLRLGFEPELTHDSHDARWREIRRRLAAAPAPQQGQRGQGGTR